MSKARQQANLSSDGNLFADISNDRVGVGSVVPTHKLHVNGTSKFDDDVKFEGTTAAKNILWDKSVDALKVSDDGKITFGGSADLSLYHDSASNNSYIKEGGSGNLYIFSENLRIENADGSDSYIEANNGGAVELFWDGGKKLETTNTGAKVTGNLEVTGVLTYDDVTSIDSIGIVTARGNVHIAEWIAHLGDLNTTIGFPSNDTITFNTSSAERLRIDSSGHMGLGITPSDIDSIGRALNIASSTGGAIYLQDTDSPTGKFAAISYNGGTAALQIHAHHSSSYIDFGTNGTERLRITSGGVLCVGATAASGSEFLRVKNELLVMNTASTGDAFVKIKAGESGGSVLEFQADEGDDNDDYWRIQNAGDGLLGFRTKASGSWVEKLHIASNGDLTNTLQDTSFVTTKAFSNLAKLDIRGTNIANSNHYLISYGEGHANDHEFHMVNTIGDLVFRTGSGNNTDRLHIASDGKWTIKNVSGMALDLQSSAGTGNIWLEFSDTDGTRKGYLGYGSSGSEKVYWVQQKAANMSMYSNGNDRFEVQSDGKKIVKNGNLNILSTYIDFSGSISTPSTAAAIYRPADNSLAVSTANTEKLKIDGSGILYHKPSGASSSAYLKAEGNSTSYILKAQKDGAADTNLAIQVQDGGSLKQMISVVGGDNRVAIGPNITPIRNLHVQEHFLVGNIGTNGGQPYVSSTPILAVTTDGSSVVPGDTTYRHNALVSFGVGGHNAGNPGSNNCPSLGYFKLDLYGQTGLGDVGTNLDSTLSIRSINPNNTRLRIRTKDNYNGTYPDASISFTQQQDTEIARIECDTETGAANQADLVFYTNFGGLYERMRIKKTGNIGINQSNPQRYLHITGNDGGTGATLGNSDTTLVLDNAGTNGAMIEFLGANNGAGHLMFTDTDGVNRGRISYHHNGDYVRIDAGGVEQMRIDDTNIDVRNNLYIGGGIGAKDGGRIHTNGNQTIYGFQVQHSTHVLITNEQGSTQQAMTLGDTSNGTNTSVLWGVSVKDSGNSPSTGSSGWSQKIRVEGNGDLVHAGSHSASGSDDRLKKNKVGITSALTKVCGMEGFIYEWNDVAEKIGMGDGDKHFGLSAQTVKPLAPEVVVINDSLVNPDDGTNDYMTIRYEKLVPLLVEAIKDLKTDNDALKARVATLEGS